MCKLTVIITYKGKQIIREFENDGIKLDYTIKVLLSNKDSSNNYDSARYHYICKLYNNKLMIPDTSLIPHETSFININLISDEFKNMRRNWKLPLHAIGCQCDVFPLGVDYSIEL